MEKEDQDRKPKDGRDETKPGVIVAGPEAHARERKGADPEPQDAPPPKDRG